MFRLIRHSAWCTPRDSFCLKKLISQYQPYNRYATKAPQAIEPVPKSSKGEVIYRYETAKFYRIANMMGMVLQLGVLKFSYECLKAINTEIDTDKKLVLYIPFLKDTEFNEKRFKKGCVALMILFSTAVFFSITMYTLRSVKALALLKDKTVAIVTYSPWSRHRILRVPLDHVSGICGRTPDLQNIPLRVKGAKFNFMVDLVNGKFENLKLFDTVINVYRNFK